MIIDAHTHLNLLSDKIRTQKQQLEDLKKFRKKAKIDKTIVFATLPSLTEDALTTSNAIKLCENEKNIFVVAGISILFTNDDLQTLRKYLEQKKIVGIKFYTGYEPFYPSDKRADKIYELCEEFDVPAIFHSGDTFKKGVGIKYSQPIHIDELAIKRPNLKIIIAHLGNPWLIDTMEMLYRHDNVYTDISALVWSKFDKYFQKYYNDQIVHIIKWSAKNKLIFGTDWPCNDDSTYETYMTQYVEFVNKLKISKKDKEKIFHLNAETLFKI
ncbi:MAG: amidohydrolase family protein [Candidatus Woesearchaeota archaeon]|jgi:hypothetical protein